MPELPEVETIRRGLKGFILHEKITKVKVFCEKSFVGRKFEAGKVAGLRRRGKALIIDLDNGNSLLIHLRMTGQLIYDGDERFAAGHPSENFVAKLPNGQTRVMFELENGGRLYFNDQRKFGFVKIIKTCEVEEDAFIKKLAKEPWEMTANELLEKLKKHKNSAIKAVILDQTIVAGLGNIYADESLYAAKIHPERRAGSLGKEEVEKLLEAMREVMEKSLEAGGSTIKNYVKADGTRGDYLDLFAKAYGRAGKPCERCGAILEKKKVAGRGTNFCPQCQSLIGDNK